MSEINYSIAADFLNSFLNQPELAGAQPKELPLEIANAISNVFKSKTQSYREVLLGSATVRYFNKSIDLTLPYAGQGPNAYNGRSLDERVINPFLHFHEFPASKGPFLATFRRSVKFDEATSSGLRDKESYSNFLMILKYLTSLNENEDIENLIGVLVENFIVIRDASRIEIAKIKSLSLEKTTSLVEDFLNMPSGGLIPVILSVTLLETLNFCYKLNRKIEFQGINTADAASNAAGDITVIDNLSGKITTAYEVTERPIEESRIVSTFNTKIVRKGLDDYFFIYTDNEPNSAAKQAAEKYFTQGYSINFLSLMAWIKYQLSTLGSEGRQYFLEFLTTTLEKDKSIPSRIKVQWNQIVQNI